MLLIDCPITIVCSLAQKTEIMMKVVATVLLQTKVPGGTKAVPNPISMVAIDTGQAGDEYTGIL